MRAVLTLRTAIVAPAIGALGSAAAVAAIAVIATAIGTAVLRAIGAAILPPIRPGLATFALGGSALAVRLSWSWCTIARALTAATAPVAITAPTSVGTALARWCRLAGRRLGTCRHRGRRIALTLIGALIAALIGPALALMPVPTTFRTTIDRTAITTMTPTRTPDLDEWDLGCGRRDIGLRSARFRGGIRLHRRTGRLRENRILDGSRSRRLDRWFGRFSGRFSSHDSRISCCTNRLLRW